MSDDTKTSEPLPRVLMAFIGLTPTDSFDPLSEPKAMFVRITAAQAVGDDQLPRHNRGADAVSMFDAGIARALRACTPGAVFDLGYDGKTVTYKTKQLPEMRLTGPTIVSWIATERAYKHDRESAKRLVDNPREALYDALAPVRTAYWRLPSTTCDQLIADVVTMIVRPRAPKSKATRAD